MPQIADWQRRAVGGLTVALISEGSGRANRAMAAQHGLTAVLRQRASEVGNAYQAHGTPSAVLVHSDGTIGSPVVSGAQAVRALVESVLTAPALPREARMAAWGSPNGRATDGALPMGRLRKGDPAPAFALPDLQGNTVRLEDTQGVERLVVSWNPSCRFCEQLMEPLKAWEGRTPSSVRRLLLVARGDAGEMAAAGFRSTVLMDDDGGVSQAFGLTGTPMGLLLDAGGRVVSETAAGPQAVLELAERRARDALPNARDAVPVPSA
jgi:hypothetical protein